MSNLNIVRGSCLASVAHPRGTEGNVSYQTAHSLVQTIKIFLSDQADGVKTNGLKVASSRVPSQAGPPARHTSRCLGAGR